MSDAVRFDPLLSRKNGGILGGMARTRQGIVPPLARSDARIWTLMATHKDCKVSGSGGLFLLIKASGSKSWRVKHRSGGKEKPLVIGDESE